MGSLDSALRDIAPTIIAIFVDEPSPMQRTRDVYDEATGKTTPVIDATASVKISPPAPFEVKEVDGIAVLAQDLLSFAPALSLDDANFDPIPTTEVTVTVEVGGVRYKVIRAERFRSGDEDALYGLHLRK